MRRTTEPAPPAAAPQRHAIARVLVVDDSVLQRHILRQLLTGWGFEVTEAENGAAALDACRTRMPNLVLSDWMMPGLTGPEFCRAFRQLKADSYAYFILLTSKSDKAEVALGLDSGADDFLSKPVDRDELRARIAAGERILRMQRELTEKNLLISDTLTELRRLYDSVDKDLIEAKKLQQSLVRDRHRRFPQGELSLVMRSAGHVGGDLVGFFPAGGGKLGVYGLDVSGHGISSALMTARLAGYLSASAPDQNLALRRLPDGGFVPRPPAEVVLALNDLVLNEMETEHYFTLLLAVIDLETGKVVLSQAGHPHPVIQRADGRVEQVGSGGFPVGLVPGISFEEIEVRLHPGDRLLILSDGVTECPDPAGAMLDDAGLARMLHRLRDTRGPALLEALIWELSDHAGGDAFPDDVSGVLFEYSG